jgi:hypothetical protein
MSGLVPNSLTLYLRPIEYIPPFVINDCATWLVKNGKFPNIYSAKMWLANTSYNNAYLYKAVLANFFDATNYLPSVVDHRDVNRYRSNGIRYGQEAHMWWSM